MTYLTPAAIRRGPHLVNMTAIPSKHDPAALRLMEMMPYIDRFELKEGAAHPKEDWIYGGGFLGYRNPKCVKDGCDPVRADGTWYHTPPTTVALTDWGTGGWNGDRTFVVLYDTTYNALRVTTSKVAIFSRKDDIMWKTWFHAPTVLRRMLIAYQTLILVPWETSNKEDGWGVDMETIKTLLRKHGWPDSFDPDQFNAEFTRAKHLPSKHGPAALQHALIQELEHDEDWEGGERFAGRVRRRKQTTKSLGAQLAKEKDYQEKWALKFRLQSNRWSLEREEAALAAAKQEVARLCPDDVCTPPEEIILWEFHSLEKGYNEAQRATSAEKMCKYDLEELEGWVPFDPVRYDNCLTRLKREANWLELAYNQTKAEALEHCAETGHTLFPQLSLEELVEEQTEKFEADIAGLQTQSMVMGAWLETVPEDAEGARNLFEMESSAVANAPWYLRERIGWMKEMLNGSEESKKGRISVQSRRTGSHSLVLGYNTRSIEPTPDSVDDDFALHIGAARSAFCQCIAARSSSDEFQSVGADDPGECAGRAKGQQGRGQSCRAHGERSREDECGE
ncbi:hypothetical protein EK21DRAFT_94268 [Setomelanomma holmii]|uniref:Uncharacterized protein n=1 Tax=Setomelanomma holmii TaxID=210430 RepID=A0A9P4GYB0_9PLEO|nr:hypothetical protein EK21DRAFT_94268 [Setomelanomma holmii]